MRMTQGALPAPRPTAYAGEAADAVAAQRWPRMTRTPKERDPEHGHVWNGDKRPKGKPVNAGLANGASAASQVATINRDESVRSRRAANATDESQTNKARLARRLAAFVRRNPPCTMASCVAVSAPVPAESFGANPRCAAPAAPESMRAAPAMTPTLEAAAPTVESSAPDEALQADGDNDQGCPEEPEADGETSP